MVDDARRPDPKIAAGRVIGQDPAPGSTARRQRSLRVWLSAGQRAATMPPLIGETERAAELLWVELRSMALDSCATDEQVVWLARRYANALEGASHFVCADGGANQHARLGQSTQYDQCSRFGGCG